MPSEVLRISVPEDPVQTEALNELARALHSKEWRAYCTRGRAVLPFPAGLTYLSQLMAHDAVMSVKRRNAFQGPRSAGVINMVEAPFTLSTIYGRAGAADQVIYDAKQRNKFDILTARIDGAPVAMPRFLSDPRKRWSLPALADQRNFDSPVLTQIALEFMLYHNRLIDHFAAMGVDSDLQFCYARAVVVRTWLNIIEHEVLAHLAPAPVVDTMPPLVRLGSNEALYGVLAQAVSRCFHALVLDHYEFRENVRKTSTRMLASNLRGPRFESVAQTQAELSGPSAQAAAKWLSVWQVDWTRFFDAAPVQLAINRTGFSPSFAFRKDGAEIAARDFKSAASAHNLMRSADLRIPQDAQDKLFGDLDKIVPRAGSQSWTDWGRAHDLPLVVALLAQGFYDGGGAGPLGSIGAGIADRMFRPMLERAHGLVDDILEAEQITGLPQAKDLPASFMAMIEQDTI